MNYLKLFFIYLLIFSCSSTNNKRIEKIDIALNLENFPETYLKMDEYFDTKEIHNSDNVFLFPERNTVILPKEFKYENKLFNTQKYLDSSYTQGFLVLHEDSISYESYYLGQNKNTRHISWSVAKSFVSALMGIAIDEGFIKSIEDNVEKYLPELSKSGYNGVKIRELLQMSSGIKFDETYSDMNSDINRYWRGFVLGESQDAFASTLKNKITPGTFNHYVSINTHVLGMIIVKTTGKSLTEYLEEKIWKIIGMEYNGYWLVDGEGMEMALGGLNATLRDYTKMGKLFLDSGRWKGLQIVPEEWVLESTSINGEHLEAKSINSAHPNIGYGYQWWIPGNSQKYGNEEEFMAIGIYNQFIYVNRSTKTVIVKNSANKNYYDRFNNPYASKMVAIELFREIAHMNKLQTSE
jgi:CubicO group peptidase (beta-lactamase class C family)